MKTAKALYHRHRFPAAAIRCAVRWLRETFSTMLTEEERAAYATARLKWQPGQL